MVRRKQVRTRGKVQLSRYFQDLKKGDSVAVVRELSVSSSFPKRLQGNTGEIIERRGGSYLVKMKENNKEKEFIIEPIHLKRIKK